jgi:hypothetical protein
MEVFRRSARSWGHLLVDLSLAPTEPGIEKYVSNGSVRLTLEELEEYAEEIQQLQNRWRERTQGTDDGRTTYSVYLLIQPYPDQDVGLEDD